MSELVSDYVRTKNGTVHKPGCTHAGEYVPWDWAEGKTVEQITAESRQHGIEHRWCLYCFPIKDEEQDVDDDVWQVDDQDDDEFVDDSEQRSREHAVDAERMLDVAGECDNATDAALTLTKAQVHAQLARYYLELNRWEDRRR